MIKTTQLKGNKLVDRFKQLSKSEIKELIKVEVKKYFEETFENPDDLEINEILRNLYK